jgi:hypothetical protein
MVGHTPAPTAALVANLWSPRHPIESAFGDVHDLCTRNHKRKRWRELGANVVEHLHVNGPWPYQLSELSDAPAVTVAVERMVMKNTLASAG